MGLTDGEAARIEQFFFKKDREGLRELAAVWDPAIPVSRNEAYVKRSRELNAELETALVSHLDDGEPPDEADERPASAAELNARSWTVTPVGAQAQTEPRTPE